MGERVRTAVRSKRELEQLFARTCSLRGRRLTYILAILPLQVCCIPNGTPYKPQWCTGGARSEQTRGPASERTSYHSLSLLLLLQVPSLKRHGTGKRHPLPLSPSVSLSLSIVAMFARSRSRSRSLPRSLQPFVRTCCLFERM